MNTAINLETSPEHNTIGTDFQWRQHKQRKGLMATKRTIMDLMKRQSKRRCRTLVALQRCY